MHSLNAPQSYIIRTKTNLQDLAAILPTSDILSYYYRHSPQTKYIKWSFLTIKIMVFSVRYEVNIHNVYTEKRLGPLSIKILIKHLSVTYLLTDKSVCTCSVFLGSPSSRRRAPNTVKRVAHVLASRMIHEYLISKRIFELH